MLKYLGALFTVFFVSNASAAEIFSVDLAIPLDSQISASCPWISRYEVQKVVIANPEKIGWTGGDVGSAIGTLFGKSGADVNYSNIAGNVPQNTKAVVMDTQYYNNNGQAQIVVNELSLISSVGDKITMTLNDSVRVLSQTQGHAGQAILVCFTNDEDFVRVSAKVSHQNVDGSRPTMGFSAFTAVGFSKSLN